jgi:translation initiation factor 6 (eIF-6)
MNEMKNNNDTTREDIKHIIGACMCKDDDKSCWYTNNAQEVENDSTVHDNQVNAVLNLILQDRESAVREAKLEAEAKQAIQAHIDKKVNEARIDEWKLISEVTHSANLVASSYLGKARDERIKQLRSEL